MPCEHCKDEKPLYSAHERGMGAEITIEDDSLMIDLFSDFVEIVITHCPMCGESLTPIKPLTLEQLRDRDGKPVWVECGAEYNNVRHWGIVCLKEEHEDYTLHRQCPIDRAPMTMKEYGITWLAYDREPQTANETKGG